MLKAGADFCVFCLMKTDTSAEQTTPFLQSSDFYSIYLYMYLFLKVHKII